MPVHNERSWVFGATAGVSVAAVVLLFGRTVPSTPDTLSSWFELFFGGAMLLFGVFATSTAHNRRPSSALLLALCQLALSGAVASLSSRQAGALSAGTAVLALVQLWLLRSGLREREPQLGRWRYCLAFDTRAAPEALWRVVGQVGDIARYMPELASSELRGCASPGAGAVRACQDRAGSAWAEAITRYDAERFSFDVRFLHEEARFPYPVSAMFGGWRIAARGSGSRVEIWWSLTPSARLFPWVVVALMGLRVDQSLARVVARMDAAARGAPAQVHPRPLPVAGC